jgi:hypothetical protein
LELYNLSVIAPKSSRLLVISCMLDSYVCIDPFSNLPSAQMTWILLCCCPFRSE